MSRQWCFCHYYMCFLRELLNILFGDSTSRTFSHNLNISYSSESLGSACLYFEQNPEKATFTIYLQFLYFSENWKYFIMQDYIFRRHHSPGTLPDKTEFTKHTQRFFFLLFIQFVVKSLIRWMSFFLWLNLTTARLALVPASSPLQPIPGKDSIGPVHEWSHRWPRHQASQPAETHRTVHHCERWDTSMNLA